MVLDVWYLVLPAGIAVVERGRRGLGGSRIRVLARLERL